MPPFDFVFCLGVIFVKFICICLTDLATAYVSTLHCDILNSCEQMSNWHLQHYRGLRKGDPYISSLVFFGYEDDEKNDCRSTRRHYN